VSERAARPPPDFGAQVAEAQRRLAESVTRAGLNRDAYRHVLEAHVVALAVLPAFVAEIEARRQPWTRDERRAAALDFVARMDGHLARRMVQFNRWGMVGVAAIMLAFGCATFWSGWYWHAHFQRPPIAAVTSCRPAPQPDGGAAFECTFWTRTPNGGAQ
jgi:hypothetical protein